MKEIVQMNKIVQINKLFQQKLKSSVEQDSSTK